MSKNQKRKLLIRTRSELVRKVFAAYATLAASFVLAFVCASILAPAEASDATSCTNGVTPAGSPCGTGEADVNVSVSSHWTVSVASEGTLNLDIMPTAAGAISAVTDNVSVFANTPNGYQLYLNSRSGSSDIYNSSLGEQGNHFSANGGTIAVPAVLDKNTWGYALGTITPTASSTWRAVQADSSTSESLATTGNKTTTTADSIPVTYGFNASTDLQAGTYTAQVLYTAIGEVPNYTISSVTPAALTLDQAGTNFTIMTTTPTSELELGEISGAELYNTGTGVSVALTGCSETTASGYRGVTCAYPGGTVGSGGLPVGSYNARFTSAAHSATYETTNTPVTVDSGYNISSVSPNSWRQYDNGSRTLTITTNASATNSTAFGTVTAKLGSTNLTSCSAGTSGGYRTVSCTYPGNMATGTYAIEFTASGHGNKTYTLANAVTINAENYSISSVSPTSWRKYATGTITITLDALTASSTALGTVTAKVGTTNLTGCTATTNGNYRAVQCTYPSNITAGTYAVSVTASGHGSKTYTKSSAVTVSAESYSITSVTPTTGNNDAATTITMVTSALTNSSTAFGTVTGKIGSTDMTNCTATTSGDYRAVSCTIPSGMTAGTYAVQFTAAGHANTTYTKASAVTIRAYLTVSGGSGSGWYAPNTTVNISASSCSSGYTFDKWTTTGGTLGNASASSTTIKIGSSNVTVTRNCKSVCASIASGGTGTINGYAVKKLADDKCWQTVDYKTSTTWSNSNCPSGFTFPSKTDFDTLISKYGDGGKLYTAWGLSKNSHFWSSTMSGSNGTSYSYYRLRVYSNMAVVEPEYYLNSSAVRCYAQ